MALYVISWMDKPGSLERRLGAREDHFAHIAKHADQVRVGGPFLDEQGQMCGSMLVFEADSLDEAKAFHDADPYKLAGLFETSEVRPWRATVGGLAARRSTES